MSLTVTMPNGARIFEDGGIRGIDSGGGRGRLKIHRDGTLEYDSPTAEYSLVVSQRLTDQLFAAFEGRNGRPLEDAIELPEGPAPAAAEEDEENPRVEQNPQGGRKRRTRRARKTRRRRQ